MSTGETLIWAEQAKPIYDGVCQPSLEFQLRPEIQVCMVGNHVPIMGSYLRMLAAVEAPCAGEVTVLGQRSSIMDTEQRRALRLEIAFVAREAPLLSVFNGINNVKIPAQYHAVGTAEEIEQRAHELIDELEYQADHGVLPAYMTGLQARHLAIVRALMLQPQVLFIDDPFIGLDNFAREKLGPYLDFLVKKRRVSIITSNADMLFIKEYADMVIHCGREKVLTFEGWDSFISSDDEEVVGFVTRERNKCASFG